MARRDRELRPTVCGTPDCGKADVPAFLWEREGASFPRSRLHGDGAPSQAQLGAARHLHLSWNFEPQLGSRVGVGECGICSLSSPLGPKKMLPGPSWQRHSELCSASTRLPSSLLAGAPATAPRHSLGHTHS